MTNELNNSPINVTPQPLSEAIADREELVEDAKNNVIDILSHLGLSGDKKESAREFVAKAKGISAHAISDEELTETLRQMHKNGTVKSFLRRIGVTPKVGVLAAIFGLHHVEHIRSSGLGNKLTGIGGLVGQAVTIGLGIYLGIGWKRSAAKAEAAAAAAYDIAA